MRRAYWSGWRAACRFAPPPGLDCNVFDKGSDELANDHQEIRRGNLDGNKTVANPVIGCDEFVQDQQEIHRHELDRDVTLSGTCFDELVNDHQETHRELVSDATLPNLGMCCDELVNDHREIQRKVVADETLVESQSDARQMDGLNYAMPLQMIDSDGAMVPGGSTEHREEVRQAEEDCGSTESTLAPVEALGDVTASIWTRLRMLAAQMIILTDEDEQLEDILYSRLLDKQHCLSLPVLSARLQEVSNKFTRGGRCEEAEAFLSMRRSIPNVGLAIGPAPCRPGPA